jgi:hypothetical protein
MRPWFIATERFDQTNAGWEKYIAWSQNIGKCAIGRKADGAFLVDLGSLANRATQRAAQLRSNRHASYIHVCTAANARETIGAP